MADLDRLARAIFGTKRAETETDNVGVFEQTKTIYADATSDSSNGSVMVYIPGMMTTVDGETDIELPTTTDVKDGDSVIITLTGGTAAHPVVTGVVGGGDRTRADVDNAVSDASHAVDTAGQAADTATDARDKAQEAEERVEVVSTKLETTSTDILATIDSKVTKVQTDVDTNASDVNDLNTRLSDEIKARQSFMRFSEESSDPTLTLGQTDSPAQVKLTNKQLQFLYLNTVVAYMSGDALLINNAKILQQLQLGGFAFVPRDNGNLAFKWVGGD